MKPFKILRLALLLVLCLTINACSDSDSPGTITAIDTAPPALPTGLQSVSENNIIKISWDPNTTDSDFSGFLVYRMAYDQTWLLTPVAISATKFIDPAPLPGRCTYGITSIDTNGNESARTLLFIDVVMDPKHVHMQ